MSETARTRDTAMNKAAKYPRPTELTFSVGGAAEMNEWKINSK